MFLVRDVINRCFFIQYGTHTHTYIHTYKYASSFCNLVLAKISLQLSVVVMLFWTSQVLSYEGSNHHNDHTMCLVDGSGVVDCNNRHWWIKITSAEIRSMSSYSSRLVTSTGRPFSNITFAPTHTVDSKTLQILYVEMKRHKKPWFPCFPLKYNMFCSSSFSCHSKDQQAYTRAIQP